MIWSVGFWQLFALGLPALQKGLLLPPLDSSPHPDGLRCAGEFLWLCLLSAGEEELSTDGTDPAHMGGVCMVAPTP